MKKWILVLVSALSLNAQATTRREVINNISANVILKTYQDLVNTAVDLQSKIEVLKNTPTQANLVAAQNAWRAARGAYEVSEGFLFGPMDALGIDPMIDTWPLALKDLRAVLTSNFNLDLEFIRSLGSNVQGFHAIEFLLFGEGIVSNTKDVATITPREYQYMTAATTLLVEQVNLLMYAWNTHHDPEDDSTPGYIDVISNPGANNSFYSSELAVIQEFSNGIVGIIAEASKAKLPDATGNDIQDANASLEESPFSWNSINDYTSNINSVYNVYTGSYAGQKGPGLKELVADKDPALANQVEALILQSRALIVAIPGPTNMSFGQAIKSVDGRQRIFAAIKALKALQAVLESQVVPLLQ